jgi:transposase InsO family protein
VLVHSDVWTCHVTSINGMKYFITFIDCFSRMTWFYVMKHKDEVLNCFQKFHELVNNKFNTQVKMIITDNGTEYVNKDFNAFVSRNGILSRPLVLIHLHKMGWLRERIVTFWRLLIHLCLQ